MRRITLVAPVRDDAGERELRDTSGWLRELPIAWLTRVARLSEVALDQTEVLWIGSMLEPEPLLTDWLRSGGRLFATQDAAGILCRKGSSRIGPPPCRSRIRSRRSSASPASGHIPCSPGCEKARSSDPPAGASPPA
jgi:hypothetical protein